MQGFPESRLPKFLPEDSARILGAYDFLGVNSYTGGLAIEPHVATVFHAVDGEEPDWQQCYDSYVEYGHATNKLAEELGLL